MSRVYNFSAGPAVLPEVVLQEAAEEMMDYRGCGMSVMEMSHRSKMFETIIQEAEADLRELLQIPDNYKVLFLQGGASQQFAMIPMNLMKNRVADYIVTGQWAKKAWQEARKYGKANKIASSEDKTFSYIPDCSDLDISRMLIMCIFVKIIPFMAQNLKLCQIPRAKSWFLMFPPVSCQNLWISVSMGLYTVEFRKISDRQAW